MLTEDKIKRINELARKSKEGGLSEEECKEQQCLRREYIEAVKARTREHLDRIKIVDKDEGPKLKSKKS
jgi:uncharacterized protein YnzC (UPF0291/DUF896 family)